MRKLYILGLIALAAVIIGLAWAEQLTFTTYYPAPYGVYNEMRVMKSLGVGTMKPKGKLDVADVLYNKGSGACPPGYIEMDYDGEGDLADCWRGMVVKDGNVGIGTTSPGAKLHVGGTAGTDGIMFPDGTLQTTAAGGQSMQVVGTTNITAPDSWADMANMTISMNTNGGNVLLMFSGNIHAAGNDNVAGDLRFSIDGNPKHTMRATAGDGACQNDFAMQWLQTSLPAGSYTFKVQWKGGGDVWSPGADYHNVKQDGATYPRVFTAIEL